MKLSVGKILSHWTSKKPNKDFKVWEIQLSWTFSLDWIIQFAIYPWCMYLDLFGVIGFNIRKDSKCDHEGFYMNLKFLGIDIDINYYDVRHWDYDNKCHEDGGDPENWGRI